MEDLLRLVVGVLCGTTALFCIYCTFGHPDTPTQQPTRREHLYIAGATFFLIAGELILMSLGIIFPIVMVLLFTLLAYRRATYTNS